MACRCQIFLSPCHKYICTSFSFIFSTPIANCNILIWNAMNSLHLKICWKNLILYFHCLLYFSTLRLIMTHRIMNIILPGEAQSSQNFFNFQCYENLCSTLMRHHHFPFMYANCQNLKTHEFVLQKQHFVPACKNGFSNSSMSTL